MNTRTTFRAFSGGEVAPDVLGRSDLSAVRAGLRECRNFVVSALGPAIRRGGFAHINTARANATVRLIPFVYAVDQSLVLQVASVTHAAGLATSVGGSSLTLSGAGWTVNQFAGYFIECAGSTGLILSNTADTLTLSAAWIGGTPTGFLSFTVYLGYIRFHGFGLSLNVLNAGVPPAYNAGTSYSVGDLVLSGPTIYYSRTNGNLGNTPATSFANWYALPASGEFEIPHGYAPIHLPQITFAQSFDVLTLAHYRYTPQEVRRLSNGLFEMRSVIFGSQLSAPASVVGTATATGERQEVGSILAPPAAGYSVTVVTSLAHGYLDGDIVYIDGTGVAALNGKFWAVNTTGNPGATNTRFGLRDPATGAAGPTVGTAGAGGTVAYVPLNTQTSNVYVVTAVDENSVESEPSAEVTVGNNLFAAGAYNTVTWAAVPGAVRYNVYRKEANLFGFVGETESTQFRDENIEPDLGRSPPYLDDSLNVGSYPAAVCYYEQRRCFAGSAEEPTAFWATRTGTESDLSFHLPAQDSDRIRARFAALTFAPVRHLVPAGKLLALASSAEYRVSPEGTEPLTPFSVSGRPQSFVGASYVRPLVSGGRVLFVSDRTGAVRETAYQDASEQFVPADLSLRALHLFRSDRIVDSALMESPETIAWFVTVTGKLLGLTYVPGENISSWHRHDTDGFFLACAVIQEQGADYLYVAVTRVANGVGSTRIERMRVLVEADTVLHPFLDGAKQFINASAGATLIGLEHLAGRVVDIVADRAPRRAQEVAADGTLVLEDAAVSVWVGLPYESVLSPTPLVLDEVAGGAFGRVANFGSARIRVLGSAPFEMATAAEDWVPSEPLAPAVLTDGRAQQTASGIADVDVPGSWSADAQLRIRQRWAFPLIVLGLSAEVSVGG